MRSPSRCRAIARGRCAVGMAWLSERRRRVSGYRMSLPCRRRRQTTSWTGSTLADRVMSKSQAAAACCLCESTNRGIEIGKIGWEIEMTTGRKFARGSRRPEAGVASRVSSRLQCNHGSCSSHLPAPARRVRLLKRHASIVST
jgi:hypothetical protein